MRKEFQIQSHLHQFVSEFCISRKDRRDNVKKERSIFYASLLNFLSYDL